MVCVGWCRVFFSPLAWLCVGVFVVVVSLSLSLSLCVCRNLDKAEPKYKSKAPLAYVQGTTKFYTEAIAKSKIVVTEGDAMQT